MPAVSGERLEFQLDAADADGDIISYSMFSQNNLPPGSLSGNGLLLFTPGPDSVGTFQFVVVVSDGTTTVSRLATLEVLADASGVTRITGRVIEEEDDEEIEDDDGYEDDDGDWAPAAGEFGDDGAIPFADAAAAGKGEEEDDEEDD